MIYAHVSQTMREATWEFRSFVDGYKDGIKRARATPIPMVELSDGNRHYFMNVYIYEKWCMGKTYMWGETLHHSGQEVLR